MNKKKESKKEIFAKHLLLFMNSKKMTQGDLAQAMGVNKSSVSDWVNGISMPQKTKMMQLQVIFNVSEADLTEEFEEGLIYPFELEDYVDECRKRLKKLNDAGRKKALNIMDDLCGMYMYNDKIMDLIIKNKDENKDGGAGN